MTLLLRHLCLYLLFISASTAAAFTQAQRLSLPESDGPLDVKIAFQLHNINEINDEDETLEISGVLTLQWIDARQRFDPKVTGVGELLFSGSYQFDELSPAWYPQVFLVNALEPIETSSILLRVLPDGTCTLIQTVDTTIKVDVDVSQFPFDRQLVSAIFGVLGFRADEVRFSELPQGSYAIHSLIDVPEWDFKSISSQIDLFKPPSDATTGLAANTALIVTLEIERRPMYMIRLVIIPLTLIVMLSWSVFWMERSSLGDRMSVSFVGILTAVTYQMIVSDSLPQISYITWMNAFIMLSFVLMCITVLLNLIVGALDKRGHFELGDRIDRKCRKIFPLGYLGLLGILFIYFF